MHVRDDGGSRGPNGWLGETPETLLAPFDVNSAEMINLADWKVDYEQLENESFDADDLIASAGGNVSATSTFSIPSTDRYFVRVKGIDRIGIPGSFSVVILNGDRVLGEPYCH